MKVVRMVLGPIGTNVYIAWKEDAKTCVIIDPAGDADRIREKLAELDLAPEAILLTHGHYDHILAVPELMVTCVVPVFAMEAERETLEDPQRNLTGRGRHPLSLAADRWLADGETVTLPSGLSFTALHTPGHTPGSGCFYFPEGNVLFAGDTLFEASYGRTDLPGGSGGQMLRSLLRLLTELPEETVVLPGHGEDTSIRAERRQNPVAPYLRAMEKENDADKPV